jgi:hypothetical protein
MEVYINSNDDDSIGVGLGGMGYGGKLYKKNNSKQ